MSTERYLYISYFAALAGGVALACGLAALLAGPLRRAAVLRPIGTVVRRAFPVWLLLAVLLGFMSVSYIDCAHEDYADVLADGEHLVRKTQDQAVAMMRYAAIGLVVWGMVVMLLLYASARARRAKTAKARKVPDCPNNPRRSTAGLSGAH